jgi:hypothetical protein
VNRNSLVVVDGRVSIPSKGKELFLHYVQTGSLSSGYQKLFLWDEAVGA